MRRTKKYVAAESFFRGAGIRISGDAEEMYQTMADHGYQWNSESGTWDDWGAMPRDQPTELIRVRAWARAEAVEMVADGITEAMLAAGLVLVERSKPYPCRPPKQLESRVYLTFGAR
jgi:hypothetical protein